MPSAFTGPTGRAHWETLLAARAIENLCFVVAAAQSGIHDSDRETYGDTMIVDYWGRVLARQPRGSGVVARRSTGTARQATRESFPALEHRVFGDEGDALQSAARRPDLSRPRASMNRGSSRRSASLLGASVDAADLYFQLAREEHWALEDGIVKEGSHGIEQGVGVRAMSGEKTGFAYSDEILLPALLEAARAARAIAREGGNGRCRPGIRTAAHRLYPADGSDRVTRTTSTRWRC